MRSFTSGDSNGDLHMLQAVQGAAFPIVTVRLQLAENEASASTIHADLEIEFAGQKAHYRQVELAATGSTLTVTGTIPARLADFKIDPPSLLTIPIKNEIPVRVEMAWKRP